MKHRKFVKQLMAMGISRNTAEAAAAAASRAEISLLKTAGRIKTMQHIWARVESWNKESHKDFDRLLLEWAKTTPRRIKPLRTKRTDGLRINFAAVDELDDLPSGKIYDRAMSACAGGGGNE